MRAKTSKFCCVCPQECQRRRSHRVENLIGSALISDRTDQIGPNFVLVHAKCRKKLERVNRKVLEKSLDYDSTNWLCVMVIEAV